jgi:hypothetical protein
MAEASKQAAALKLALAGQRAGFSLEQMIQLLNSGLSVRGLLDLICMNLRREDVPKPGVASGSSHWLM